MFYAYKKIKEYQRQKPTSTAALDDKTVNEADTIQPKTPHALSPEEVADKRRRRIYRWRLIAGLFGPFALQALDTTIIASALSNIATEFSKTLDP
jgi:hypothetical protein